MWLCLACGRLGNHRVCEDCLATLVPGPTRMLEGGVVLRAGLCHQGAARRLVHHLKYRGVVAAARWLAFPMIQRLPAATSAVIPLPRATTRRLRYGIDPAVVLAREVGRARAVPVIAALQPAVWWRRHAPQAAPTRTEPVFRTKLPVPEGAVLIDDVVRTGATVRAAVRALGVSGLSALAATAPPG